MLGGDTGSTDDGDALRDDANFERILRMFARFASVGYVAYLVLLLPEIIRLEPLMASWWTPVMVGAVFVPGFLLGAVSFLRDSRLTRVLAAIAAVTFMIATLSWRTAWDGTPMSGDQGVWLAAFPGLAAIAAVVAWRAWLAFAYMVVACVSVQLVNFVVRGSRDAYLLLPDILFAVMFCSLFVGGSIVALRTGRLLDESTEEAHATAAATAAQRARAVERERFDGLTHDSVMSTLLIAARGGSSETVRQLAAGTLAELDGIRNGDDSDRPFDLRQAVVHLRVAATEADPGAAFEFVDQSENRLDAGEGIPADVVRSLGAAQAEALRNCVRHAGDDAYREVVVIARPDGLRVQVSDDGAGFDPDAVPAQRLGITVSIRRRMARVPGGWAQVSSKPGHGTSVRLGWDRS